MAEKWLVLTYYKEMDDSRACLNKIFVDYEDNWNDLLHTGRNGCMTTNID